MIETEIVTHAKRWRQYAFLFLFSFVLTTASLPSMSPLSAQDVKVISVDRKDTKSLSASLILGAMNFTIQPRHFDKMFEYTFTALDTSQITHFLESMMGEDEDMDTEVTELKITHRKADRGNSVRLSDLFRTNAEGDTPSLNLALNDAIPLNLDLTIGGSSADLNLSGLRLKKLTLKSGACKTKMVFQKLNPVEMEGLKVTAGASRIVLSGIGNANVNTVHFSGGASDAVLDFTGESARDIKAKVSVGAGVVTIYLPRTASVNLNYEENLFSSVSLPDNFERTRKNKVIAETDNATHHIDITISSGVGSIRVFWK